MIFKFDSNTPEERPTKKKLSEIGGQEIINLYDGEKLGIVADVDLLIDEATGNIQALLIPEQRGSFSLFANKGHVEVPWSAIRKIGQDTLIVDIDEGMKRTRF
ncbi:MAG: YlmC/YmxH family sporulation protein [Clostridiales bacterium]|nr:YlmC/YmxH family sporulation protein [Clostridiales bacterium]HBM81229.1 YlmC/YmxH family sporulation protein [Clostridiaceae bacterium]